MSANRLDSRQTARRRLPGSRAVLSRAAAVALSLAPAPLGCSPQAPPKAPEMDLFWPTWPAAPCGNSFERLDVDSPTDLGFSAVEVVQQLSGVRATPLIWLGPARSDEYTFEFGPEPGASELSISITLAPGELGLRRAVVTGNAEEDAECGEDVLLIPVEVGLQSRGGALDESFHAVLEASSPYQGRLSARFERGTLAGGLTFGKPDSFDAERSFSVGALHLALLVWQGGSQGTLSAELNAASSLKDGPPVAMAAEPLPAIAVWPSELQCASAWVGVSSDSKLIGTSAEDVARVLAAEQPGELRWSDGSKAQLRLEFAELPKELCVKTGRSLEFESSLRARSSDGRVDTLLPVHIKADPSPLGSRSAWESIVITGSQVSSLAAGAGDAAANSLAGGSSRVRVVEVEARYERGGASGSIEVRGPDTIDSDGEPRPGTALATGEWSR